MRSCQLLWPQNVFFDSLRSSDTDLAQEAAKIFVKWLQKEGGAALMSEVR